MAFYEIIRILQMIIGIVGNALTLQIIRSFKVRKNGHILMIYTAVFDIFSSCIVPLGTTINVGSSVNRPIYWTTLCIWTDYIYLTANACSLMCYFILASDRWVNIFLQNWLTIHSFLCNLESNE